FDISTDLDELARGDGMLVVCSGFKSILDLPATLEALETRGVPVVGYQTDALPAFTTRTSGLPLELRAETPAQAAALVRAHPAPPPARLAAPAMEAAPPPPRAEPAARGIAGKAFPPSLLDQIARATAGRSLQATRALIAANARLAAEVAVALALAPLATP